MRLGNHQAVHNMGVSQALWLKSKVLDQNRDLDLVSMLQRVQAQQDVQDRFRNCLQVMAVQEAVCVELMVLQDGCCLDNMTVDQIIRAQSVGLLKRDGQRKVRVNQVLGSQVVALAQREAFEVLSMKEVVHTQDSSDLKSADLGQ